MHELRLLHEGWTVQAEGGPPGTAPAAPVPATVPGCVHTDLLAAGVIDDPYLDDNETRVAWIGHTDWIYETVFDAAGLGRPVVDGSALGVVDEARLVDAGLGLRDLRSVPSRSRRLGSMRLVRRRALDGRDRGDLLRQRALAGARQVVGATGLLDEGTASWFGHAPDHQNAPLRLKRTW